MDIHGYSHSFTTPVWAHPFDQSITLYLPLPASRGLEAWQVDDYDEWILQFSSPWWISGSNPIQWSSSLAESVEISSGKPWVPNGINISTWPPPKKTTGISRFRSFWWESICVQIWRNDFRYMDWTPCRTNYVHEFGIMSKQPSEKWKSRNSLLNHGFQSVFSWGRYLLIMVGSIRVTCEAYLLLLLGISCGNDTTWLSRPWRKV